MCIRIGIIAPDRGLGFARQFTCRLDPHILDQRFGVFLQVTMMLHFVVLSTLSRSLRGTRYAFPH